MSDYNITLNQNDLIELLNDNGDMANLLTQLLNQVLDAECREQLQASHYERTQQRQDYRNGYRSRQLKTRVGPLTLTVPQTREGTFSTQLFKTYQRSEQALVLSIGIGCKINKMTLTDLPGLVANAQFVELLIQSLLE